MTPDEEHSAINQTSDSLMTRDNTDPFASDQSILTTGDSKEKGDQSGERYSATYKNNQTEMIIPTPEGTLRLFFFHKNKVYKPKNSVVFFILLLKTSMR